MNRKELASDLVKLAKECISAWPEDDDVTDGMKERAIKEFKKHTGGEPIFTAEKIKGHWFPVTTELGAYRIGKKYRSDWKDIGEHQAYRGKWFVKI